MPLRLRPIFYKQHAGHFFRSTNFWIAHNFFQLVVWGFLESGLLAAPIYWLTGFHKDFNKFLLFWMALYLLNLNSSVIFKVLAIICPTISMAQTMAGLVQVFFFLFSGYLQPWSVLPPGPTKGNRRRGWGPGGARRGRRRRWSVVAGGWTAAAEAEAPDVPLGDGGLRAGAELYREPRGGTQPRSTEASSFRGGSQRRNVDICSPRVVRRGAMECEK